MAMSVNPTDEGNLSNVMGHHDPVAMIRPRSTVPIRACGHVVPRQQAGHMTARFRFASGARKPLRVGGHPHMTLKIAARTWRVAARPAAPQEDAVDQAQLDGCGAGAGACALCVIAAWLPATR